MDLLLACLKRQHWLRFAHNAFFGAQPNRRIRLPQTNRAREERTFRRFCLTSPFPAPRHDLSINEIPLHFSLKHDTINGC